MKSSGSSSCTRCGGDISTDAARDARGNSYCHACMERLYGVNMHAAVSGHVCGICGETFVASAQDAPAGKGNYCIGCLGRLRGSRPKRREVVAAPASRIDQAFEQMLEEMFSPAVGVLAN